MEKGEKNVKELVDDLRREWKLMWWSRIDDKIRAEGIADKTFDRLFVDRGTVLYATRGCKPLEFREVLEKYLSPIEAERFNPDPRRGGIRKFIRDYIISGKKDEAKLMSIFVNGRKDTERCARKNGGKGWLHISLC